MTSENDHNNSKSPKRSPSLKFLSTLCGSSKQNLPQKYHSSRATNDFNTNIQASSVRNEQGLKGLFEDLKAHQKDEFILASTVLAYLETQDLREKEPEYYSYMHKALSEKEKLSQQDFLSIFLNIKQNEHEAEDLDKFFSVLDRDKKGYFKKEEFMEVFRFSDLYKSDPVLFEQKLDELFVYIERVLGRKEIKKTDFLTFMNLHQ